MAQEDKELLLKDLCARLPYGVKMLVDNKHWCDFDGRTPSEITFDNSYRLLFLGTKLGYVKPYLFPLSSITEEQKQYISDRWGINENFDFEIDPNWGEYIVDLCDARDFIDWLNENHFDYRWLIEKGLAIDATDKNIY